MADASPALTCESCDATFQPKPELLERYPGWRPRSCPSCYAASRRSADAPEREPGGDGTTGHGTTGHGTTGRKPTASPSGSHGKAGGATTTRRRGGGSSKRSGFSTESLTVAEVLDRYTEGPDTGVFTDGSAIPNPGPGGWGAVYVVDGEIVAQEHGADPDTTTNNRMELLAILRGIELVPDGTPATVYTDSNLAAQTVNTWAAGWAARGWRRKTGPVENLDLVQPLFEALQQRPELTVTWIRAHAGNRWNEYADSLSTAYRRDSL